MRIHFAAVAAIGAAAWLSACSSDIGSGKGSGGAGGNAGAAGSAGDDGGVVVPPLSPAAGGIRRVTGTQYVNSIRLLLGEPAALAAKPPPDAQDNGFETIGASKFAFSDQQVADLEDSARLVAKAVASDLGSLAALVPCTPTGPADAACHRQFVEEFGRLAWRRPLTQEEIDEVTAVAQLAATHTDINDFNVGIEYAISTLLQSPNFIYIIELGEPDPEHPGQMRLTGWEVAARMSFFLLQRTPDSHTLNIVEQTGLDANEEIASLAKTMLLKPEARQALASFYGELFRLRELPTVAKDAAVYPKFSPALVASMQQETQLLLEDVIWTRNADARELLDANYTFVDAELAKIYGVTAPASGFAKLTLPAAQNRAGLIGHASLLTRFAHPATTSPTKRGLFIRTVMLCDEVDPPPPGVVTELPLDDGAPKTMKQKLAQHQADTSCAGCHAKVDPIGFAIDTFDGIGEHRTTDKGLTIDTTASVEDIGDFTNARELAALLRADPRAPRCMMLNLYRNSMGHMETPGEEEALVQLDQAFATTGYRIQDLLVEIVKHPAFRRVGAPK